MLDAGYAHETWNFSEKMTCSGRIRSCFASYRCPPRNATTQCGPQGDPRLRRLPTFQMIEPGGVIICGELVAVKIAIEVVARVVGDRSALPGMFEVILTEVDEVGQVVLDVNDVFAVLERHGELGAVAHGDDEAADAEVVEQAKAEVAGAGQVDAEAAAGCLTQRLRVADEVEAPLVTEALLGPEHLDGAAADIGGEVEAEAAIDVVVRHSVALFAKRTQLAEIAVIVSGRIEESAANDPFGVIAPFAILHLEIKERVAQARLDDDVLVVGVIDGDHVALSLPGELGPDQRIERLLDRGKRHAHQPAQGNQQV